MELSNTQFFAILTMAVYTYYYEDVDPEMKPKDTPPDDLKAVYDFIIVGAGSSGCVVANRLSENPNWHVLVLEAGGDEDALTDTPYLITALTKTKFDWNFTTTKQRFVCGATDGICPFPRGKALGGSSVIGGMVHVRGNKADFNDWCGKYQNPGWCYDDVLPYFIKSENVSNKVKVDPAFHGTNGPLRVQYPVYTPGIAPMFIRAGIQYGLEEIDYNGKNQIGIGYIQFNLRGRSRDSNAKAYLNPIRSRVNLHISKLSEVVKINFDTQGKRATGVKFIRDGKMYNVKASKEVILSAGAVSSPKLLMLSGIGPKQHLESLNITVKEDLPVGKNLKDHTQTQLYFTVDQNKSHLLITSERVYNNDTILEYAKNGNGPLTFPLFDVTAFINVMDKSNPAPNVQFKLLPGFLVRPNKSEAAFEALVTNVASLSVGDIKLRSSDPFASPLINPNYLNNEADRKLKFLGTQELLKFMETPAMKSLGVKLDTEQQPKCSGYVNSTDDYLKCVIVMYTLTEYHSVGTAKMGPAMDKTTVVSSQLLVHGFQNLRVVDASIMPSIPRGNTNAASTMIGEKGSDIIKSAHGIQDT